MADSRARVGKNEFNLSKKKKEHVKRRQRYIGVNLKDLPIVKAETIK